MGVVFHCVRNVLADVFYPHVIDVMRLAKGTTYFSSLWRKKAIAHSPLSQGYTVLADGDAMLLRLIS